MCRCMYVHARVGAHACAVVGCLTCECVCVRAGAYIIIYALLDPMIIV